MRKDNILKSLEKLSSPHIAIRDREKTLIESPSVGPLKRPLSTHCEHSKGQTSPPVTPGLTRGPASRARVSN